MLSIGPEPKRRRRKKASVVEHEVSDVRVHFIVSSGTADVANDEPNHMTRGQETNLRALFSMDVDPRPNAVPLKNSNNDAHVAMLLSAASAAAEESVVAPSPSPVAVLTVDENQHVKHGRSSVQRNSVVLSEIPDYHHDFPYPLRSNYTGVCWWDAHPFPGDVVCIPCNFDARARKYVQWHGAFCSWECALSFAHHTQNHRAIPMLWHLRSTIGERTHVRLQHALHFSELALFGGTLTIDDFRKRTTLGSIG